MLNRSGIEIVSLGAPVQILANASIFASVGCIVPQHFGIEDVAKKIVYAGTPVFVDSESLQNPVVADGAEVPAAWAFSITTAFAADETLTVDGTTYTCKATENVGSKQFAGSTAAEQVTSLLKMLSSDDYTFRAGPDDDLIEAWQKTPNATETAPVISKTSSTGAISEIEKIANYNRTDANAVLLQDVDVTAGDGNGAALILGIVNFNRLNAFVQNVVRTGVNAYGSVSILKM